MRRHFASPRRLGLVGRFAAASLVVFVAVGFAAHTIVKNQVRSDGQRNAQFHAVFVTDSLLVPILGTKDLNVPFTPSEAALVRQQIEPYFGDTVKRLKVWRPDGTIVFSDESRLIGQRFDAADDFVATQAGPHSEITDLNSSENVFERGLAPSMFSTYLRLPVAPQIMIELYQDYRPTQAAITGTVHKLDFFLLGALFLLYVLVLPIAARASRKLRATNEALRASNANLRAGEEELLRSLERERAATDRLRSLDEMKSMILTSVSHELRTPLTSIVGFALTLQRRATDLDPSTQREIAERIQQQSLKLERLLGGLLDVDRLARGVLETRREPTDVGLLTRRVVEEADVQERTVRIHADSFKANVDPSKVERILETLLTNAARHTPPGTTIDVRASMTDDGLLLVVEDDGPGIPAEYREAIFQPFVQGLQQAPHAPGAGVGLALVAGFAELHGGRAWVESSQGGGASFKVLLASDALDESHARAAS
jgi:signal transduction histidine kinase